MADCSPRVRKVLKSAWEVEAMSPGVADHITPGIAARAGLVTVHVSACVHSLVVVFPPNKHD